MAIDRETILARGVPLRHEVPQAAERSVPAGQLGDTEAGEGQPGGPADEPRPRGDATPVVPHRALRANRSEAELPGKRPALGTGVQEDQGPGGIAVQGHDREEAHGGARSPPDARTENAGRSRVRLRPGVCSVRLPDDWYPFALRAMLDQRRGARRPRPARASPSASSPGAVRLSDRRAAFGRRQCHHAGRQ